GEFVRIDHQKFRQSNHAEQLLVMRRDAVREAGTARIEKRPHDSDQYGYSDAVDVRNVRKIEYQGPSAVIKTLAPIAQSKHDFFSMAGQVADHVVDDGVSRVPSNHAEWIVHLVSPLRVN